MSTVSRAVEPGRCWDASYAAGQDGAELTASSYGCGPAQETDRLYVVDDPQVLADLARTGEAHWALSGDTPIFDAFDQVRLSTVRVWLDGVAVPDGGTVQVQMSSRGSCRERSGPSAYRITSEPLVCCFAYRVSKQEGAESAWRFSDGTYGSIELDGVVVDDEVGHACFQPVPFAPWHLRVLDGGLDLTRLSRVVMEFAIVGAGAPRETVSVTG